MDEDARIKDNTYTVVAYNKYGEGYDISASAYVGIDTPDEVETAQATDDGEKIHITWQAPTQGKGGHYYDASKVTYNVYSIDKKYQKTLLASHLKGTSYAIDNDFAGDQQTLTFAVTAVSDAGESSCKSYNMPSLVVGTHMKHRSETVSLMVSLLSTGGRKHQRFSPLSDSRQTRLMMMMVVVRDL